MFGRRKATLTKIECVDYMLPTQKCILVKYNKISIF